MKKAAIAILFSPDRTSVLLIKRSDVLLWVLPGGGIDEPESPEMACLRELFEETGIKAKIARKIGTYTPINSLAQETHVFECSTDNYTPTTSVEAIEAAFHPVSNLPYPFFFLHGEWIQDAQAQHPFPLSKKLTSITWTNLIKQLLLHPYFVGRYLLARIGFPINSRSPYNRQK